jgi:hypothetical protein
MLNPGHHVRVTIRPSATPSRVRLLLMSVVSLGILLFGIVAMHAQMPGHRASPGDLMSASAMGPDTSHTETAATVDAGTNVTAVMDVMQHGMGGMAAMDCLVLGMMCLFGAVALLLLLALTGRLRLLLRRRLAVRALAAVGWLRPPEPPSLLLLSISRT